jgi:hypothetical protein
MYNDRDTSSVKYATEILSRYDIYFTHVIASPTFERYQWFPRVAVNSIDEHNGDGSMPSCMLLSTNMKQSTPTSPSTIIKPNRVCDSFPPIS